MICLENLVSIDELKDDEEYAVSEVNAAIVLRVATLFVPLRRSRVVPHPLSFRHVT